MILHTASGVEDIDGPGHRFGATRGDDARVQGGPGRRRVAMKGPSEMRTPRPSPRVLDVTGGAVLGDVRLVILLGGPERFGGLDLGDDLAASVAPRGGQLRDVRLGLALLFVVDVPDPGTVLVAGIRSLPVELRRVMHREERLE